MNYLAVDHALLCRLVSIRQTVELRDPSGRIVLGHYTPALSPELVRQYELAMRLFDLDEVERICAAETGPGCTTEELLNGLRSLEPNK